MSMTNFEQRQLAEIERRLITEAPELDEILSRCTAGRPPRTRRARWWWAAGVAVLASVALVCAGVFLGLVALVVAAIWPPLTFLVLLLWAKRRARGNV